MNDRNFPYLANFLETWFNASYDFSELEDVINTMKRLEAWENLDLLRNEVNALGDTPLVLFNEFSDAHGGREFTAPRYAHFKELFRDVIIEDS